MKLLTTIAALLLAIAAQAQPAYDFGKLQMERLGRGLTAVRTDKGAAAISWRLLRGDPKDIAFDIERDGKTIAHGITDATFFIDKHPGEGTHIYNVWPSDRPADKSSCSLANAPYISIPLSRPADGLTRGGQPYNYSANDASVGDVDGDGEYEIILKWDPSNSHDNSHDGYTGRVVFDCYKLDGTRLWRIDMGPNIRAGAHYTQFLAYDFDGDGRAELMMKTADGTTDGQGKTIGDAKADWVNDMGRILSGPEYLTVFEGLTGRALQTVDYIPARGENLYELWGDARGNRSERYLAAVAYLDGQKPSAVFCRGYYTRTVLAAWDWDGKSLTSHWVFDSDQPGLQAFAGQGNHNIRTGDVDGDGCDEITYGSMCIDHDGTGLYTTGMGHGDAMHLTVFEPDSTRLLLWDCHENKRDGSELRDARTGQIVFQIPATFDVGRCMAADIDPTNPGLEMWSLATEGLRNTKGELLKGHVRSCNSAVWWDGDLLRELLDHNRITKYNWKRGNTETIITFDGCQFNNGTKSNPCLSADILGDWREEVVVRTNDSRELRIYTTTIPTNHRMTCLMQDPIYRLGVATENVAYNQPPHVGFYLGADSAGNWR